MSHNFWYVIFENNVLCLTLWFNYNVQERSYFYNLFLSLLLKSMNFQVKSIVLPMTTV